MFCSQCGSTVKKGAAFCINCGTKADGPVTGGHKKPPTVRYPLPTPAPPVRPRSNPVQTVVLTVCITLIILAAGAGVILVMQNQNNHGTADVSHIVAETASPPAQNAESQEETHTDPDQPGTDNQQDETYENNNESQYNNENNQDEHTPHEPADTGTGRSERFPFPGEISRNYGSTADIVFLQNTLNVVRRNLTSVRPIAVANGTFGGDTRGAVIDFQHRMGMAVTGVVDHATWYRLMYVFENPPAEADPHFTPVVNIEYVTLANLHLREGPSQYAESLGIKPEGTVVWVMEYIAYGRWFHVTTLYGETGYMKVEFLMLETILP